MEFSEEMNGKQPRFEDGELFIRMRARPPTTRCSSALRGNVIDSSSGVAI